MEEIVELDVGCRPEAAVSGPVLLQTDNSTVLTFNAMRKSFECIARGFKIETSHERYEQLWTRVYQRALRYAG